MSNNIDKLYTISQKQSKLVLGLMSGTSLDGLDIALCKFDKKIPKLGFKIERFITIPYTSTFRNQIKEIFSLSNIESLKLATMNEIIGIEHSKMVLKTLKKWGIDHKSIDIIGSHGQTIFHAPKSYHKKSHLPNCTLQIGDGDHIAVGTGIITVSDFRQKDIALGGEGAPLAVYLDFLLSNKNQNSFFINIGGISNLSYIPKKATKKNIITTDIGPGNILMNLYTKYIFKKDCDIDASYALQGEINLPLLKVLQSTHFIKLPIPKTTGAELFNLDFILNALKKSNTQNIPPQNVLATLNIFTAACIIQCIEGFKVSNYQIYISGGGVFNPLLMSNLKNRLKLQSLQTTDTLGISSEAKEAVMIALLANELISGENNISLGKISFP